jgi:vancomycin resistance protein YoaR
MMASGTLIPREPSKNYKLECYNLKMVHMKRSRKISPIQQVLIALGSGFAAFLLLFIVLNLGISLFFIGRIMPGVSMNGIPLSGLTVEEASAAITASYRFPETGNVLLIDEQNTWPVKPMQLGFYLDPLASANSAYNAGRRGGLMPVLLQRVNVFTQSVQVQPSFIFNQKTAVDALNSLALQINQPVQEANISIEGTQVIVQNGQSGRVLDVAATLNAITNQIQTMQDGVVSLVVHQSDPIILSAEAQGELARAVLSEPLTLTLPADASGQIASFQIQPSDLAPLLTFAKVESDTSAQYQIAVSQPLMAGWLNSMKSELETEPENTRFIFNDDTRQLEVKQPAVIGRTLDEDQSILSINQALQNGQHTAALGFTYTNPAVTDQMTGAELGITELIAEDITFFAGSSQERVQNIKIAAERFHMLLVAPGETLSMADVLGDISPENDYVSALIIVGDETVKGVGGGVCQVSTNLFRVVFKAGFPVLERHPHAYRVGYYEQVNASGSHNSNLAGMDASVFVPLLDFKFTNDSPYWLLMETYVNPSYNSLVWKFYSTNDGREVSSVSTGLTNIIKPPDPVYREKSDLPQGTKEKKEYAVDGADITVTRTVTRNGEVLFSDKFFTRYEPWGEVWEYGPGTEIPTPTPSP